MNKLNCLKSLFWLLSNHIIYLQILLKISLFRVGGRKAVVLALLVFRLILIYVLAPRKNKVYFPVYVFRKVYLVFSLLSVGWNIS